MKNVFVLAFVGTLTATTAFADGHQTDISMVEEAAASSISEGTGIALTFLFLLILGATSGYQIDG